MTKEIVEEGVVAERNGLFWSRRENDGYCMRPVGDGDFGPIEYADISNPRYCRRPTDKTWTPTPYTRNPHFDTLSTCRLLKVRVRTIYEVEEA